MEPLGHSIWLFGKQLLRYSESQTEENEQLCLYYLPISPLHIIMYSSLQAHIIRDCSGADSL